MAFTDAPLSGEGLDFSGENPWRTSGNLFRQNPADLNPYQGFSDSNSSVLRLKQLAAENSSP